MYVAITKMYEQMYVKIGEKRSRTGEPFQEAQYLHSRCCREEGVKN